VTEGVAAFWRNYCRLAGIPDPTPCQAWCFGDSQPMSVGLVELVLRGPKRATAGLASFYDDHPADAPVVDGYSVVTEFDGAPRAIVRTTSYERRRLCDVDAQFAWDEGEGDRTLPDWLDGHRRCFTRELAVAGKAFDDTLEVGLERFELLYPFAEAANPIEGPRIVPGYLPGAFGAMIQLQARCYTDHGFGARFEADRARDIGEFFARFDPARDGLWLVVERGEILGSIAIDGSDGPGIGHLRWLILADSLRGSGLGRRLVEGAMAFCRRRGHRVVYLTTFSALEAAAHLYRDAGFRLVAERDTDPWGGTVGEQRYEWTFDR
jgi:uncharacterized protein YhfF/ribosomal protein S18 acetylase RimI-like enzyme